MTPESDFARRPRVLVTGFGAFPGARTNPTLAIIARLARSRRAALLGVDIRVASLPVVYDGATERLAALIADVRPDAVIHLGLAARRKTLSIETRALNRLYALRPDALRRLPATMTVRHGGPVVLASRWPSERLVRILTQCGAPARRSIDAGDYVCNQTLYLTLATTQIPTGFIHVPKPAGRRRVGMADSRPTLAAMTRAIEAAALSLAARIGRANSTIPPGRATRRT